MSDIDEWLVGNEKITYDTNNYELTVDNRASYRGVVTDRRTIFITKNRVHDVSHKQVASITFAKKIYVGLLIAGIILLLISGYLLYFGYDPLFNISDAPFSFNPTAYLILIAGVILILLYIFYRPESLFIYSSGKTTTVNGPKNLLKNIMNEIRKNT